MQAETRLENKQQYSFLLAGFCRFEKYGFRYNNINKQCWCICIRL